MSDVSKVVAAALERAENAYWAEVDRLAEVVRQAYIIPFCNKHGVKFVSGMGGWSFHGRKANGKAWANYDNAGLPKRMASALARDLLNRANDLGSMTRDYTPPNYTE